MFGEIKTPELDEMTSDALPESHNTGSIMDRIEAQREAKQEEV